MFENIQRLREFLPVSKLPNPIPYEGVLDAYRLLQNAKVEMDAYIKSLMGEETYICCILMPAKELYSYHVNEEAESIPDLIFLPFGHISINLWEKLLADKENPIFQVLKYFEVNVRGIRSVLTMHGVQVNEILTSDLLSEHGIIDIFSLHSYEKVYEDVSKYTDM